MSNKLPKIIQTFFAHYARLDDILSAIIAKKGIPYLVGGAVRDVLLARDIKDVDIEVHGLSIEELEKLLASFGPVRLVGKQFGVLRLDGLDIDWSLPRKDSVGRKPDVVLDPNMTIEEACRRRDVTINAMAIDLTPFGEGTTPTTIDVIDPFDGQGDLEDHVLRAVDVDRFVEDPLRFYRVMQFIGRFEMLPDEKLTKICKNMDLKGVASERIYDELEKLFLKSTIPSKAIRWVEELGRLSEIMPEVEALVGVAQDPTHHPEGDVFEHTMQAIDAAAQLDLYYKEELRATGGEGTLRGDREKVVVMWAVLCHDLGKAVTTDEDVHAYGHEDAGVPIAKSLLSRFTRDAFLHKAVAKLVKHHLMPWVLVEEDAGPKAYKRLAKKLAPELTVRTLGFVGLCDERGRNPKGHEPLTIGEEEIALFWQKVKDAQVEEGPEEPVLLGRHLLDVMKPGPEMGILLDEAYEIQIEEGIQDPKELKRRVLAKRSSS